MEAFSKTELLTSAGNNNGAEQPQSGKRQIPGNNAFVPAAAGLLIASEVVKDIILPKK